MTNIYIISHCILNTASKVKHIMNSDYVNEENSRKRFLNKIINSGDQSIQLPCPELLMYGANRNGFARCQFDNPFYKEKCKEILNPYVMQIEEYIRNENNFNVCAIVGINGSPSCGIDFTYDAENPAGEAELAKNKTPFIINKKGVFMEVLEQLLKEKNIKVNFISINQF